MDKPHLYQIIAEGIRTQILKGEIKPGDRLPSVRQMTDQWNCTLGTIQRAYQELAQQGLVVARQGQGTHVINTLAQGEKNSLRWLQLTHRAEAFLLEALTAGYAPIDISEAVNLVLDRWKSMKDQLPAADTNTLRFAGSHDLCLSWIAAHFSEIADGYKLVLEFCGSLGGLIALAQGKVHLAGCHLWDEENDSYNVPFVKRLLPGRDLALVTLAHRRLGLIFPAGNPAEITSLSDIARPGLIFINRQPGSGTRVWLDARLHKLGITAEQIHGYQNVKNTHSEIAQAIAEGQADVGLGMEAAARAYSLDFIPLVLERYDLVIPKETFGLPAIQALTKWLVSPEAQQEIASLAGYDTRLTGQVEWIEG
ncbi:MAG: GntR family transcriptional regulator [Anaerolineales bacterium]|nr:GntR family transcriptional regulator [Anaerolineales bacterium]